MTSARALSLTATEMQFHADVNRLQQSEKGREAIRALRTLFVHGNGCSLDDRNQQAVLRLVENCWGKYRGEALNALREAAHD